MGTPPTAGIVVKNNNNTLVPYKNFTRKGRCVLDSFLVLGSIQYSFVHLRGCINFWYIQTVNHSDRLETGPKSAGNVQVQ